eukprot:76994_1
MNPSNNCKAASKQDIQNLRYQQAQALKQINRALDINKWTERNYSTNSTSKSSISKSSNKRRGFIDDIRNQIHLISIDICTIIEETAELYLAGNCTCTTHKQKQIYILFQNVKYIINNWRHQNPVQKAWKQRSQNNMRTQLANIEISIRELENIYSTLNEKTVSRHTQCQKPAVSAKKIKKNFTYKMQKHGRCRRKELYRKKIKTTSEKYRYQNIIYVKYFHKTQHTIKLTKHSSRKFIYLQEIKAIIQKKLNITAERYHLIYKTKTVTKHIGKIKIYHGDEIGVIIKCGCGCSQSRKIYHK